MKRTRFEAYSFINGREDIENEDVIKTMEALDCIYRTECHDFEDTVTSSQMIDYFWDTVVKEKGESWRIYYGRLIFEKQTSYSFTK